MILNVGFWIFDLKNMKKDNLILDESYSFALAVMHLAGRMR